MCSNDCQCMLSANIRISLFSAKTKEEKFSNGAQIWGSHSACSVSFLRPFSLIIKMPKYRVNTVESICVFHKIIIRGFWRTSGTVKIPSYLKGEREKCHWTCQVLCDWDAYIPGRVPVTYYFFSCPVLLQLTIVESQTFLLSGSSWSKWQIEIEEKGQKYNFRVSLWKI